jgi:hypothetical protein
LCAALRLLLQQQQLPLLLQLPQWLLFVQLLPQPALVIVPLSLLPLPVLLLLLVTAM